MKVLGTSFLAFLALTSADKSLEQSQYNGGSAAGSAGGIGGSSFGGVAGGFGGGAGAFGGGHEGFNSLNPVGGALEETVPGIPGDDYPIFSEVSETSFLCDGQVDGGYYADPEAECQAFHICSNDGNEGLTKYSFLCPNGTLFNQQYFVCDWWFNVDCSTAEQFYSLNDVIAAEREASSPAGAVGGGEYQGNGKGQAGGSRNGSGTSSGRKGSDSASRASASQASASSPTGSYSSPEAIVSVPDYTSPTGNGFDSVNAGYGAPGGFGGINSGSAGPGYGSPSLNRYSRRNARGLTINHI